MKQLGIYLTFNGNCEQALHFYKNCLNGTIDHLQHFGASPGDPHEVDTTRVMHAQFSAGDISLMASDSMPGTPVTSGNQVHLSLNLDNEAEQAEIFEKLSVGGNITMPLNDTFWGARFGMLVDKYGVSWMTNCEKGK